MEEKNNIAQKRIIAFVIDFFIIAIIQAIGFMAITITQSKSGNYLNSLFLCTGLTSLLLICKDLVAGQSIGKRIMKIGVHKAEDTSKIPNAVTLILRNLFLILWPIEAIVFLSSGCETRLGDKLLKTTVIEVNL